MAEINVWDNFRKGQEAGFAPQREAMTQATGAIGILGAIQKMQADAQLRGILSSDLPPEQKQQALMKIPGGIDILGKLATQQHAGITGALQQAQLGEIQRKGKISGDEQAAKGALANLIAGGGYQQNNPGEMPPTQVMTDPAAAERAAIERYQKDPNTPFAIDVPNPANVKGLAIAAGNALPRSAAAAILNPSGAGNGQSLAPRVVQDTESPTGWSYMNPKDNTKTQGAPVPASAARAASTAASAGNSGVGMMDPETLKFTAQQIIAGDRQAGQGYARSAPMKAALQNAVATEAKSLGLEGRDLARIMSEYTGFTAGQRALGTREANIQLAATVASKFAPLAITASEAFDRTDFKSLNDVEKAILSRTASPELRRFNAANMSLVNAYARAVSPNGVPAQAEKDHAREILDTGFSKGDYRAAVDQLQFEIKAELEAPGAVKKGMADFFNGKKPVTTESVTAPSGAPQVQRATSKSGKPMHMENGQWVYD